MKQYHTLKTIFTDKKGRVPAGSIVELTKAQANIYLAQGAVEPYQTKVIREVPLVIAGEGTQSSALPVEEVSQETTPKKSGRGRPKKVKEPLLPQTPPLD